MHSLNLDEMDIRELEKRLELTLAGGIANAAWSCCVDGGSCPELTCCEHGGGGGGQCTSLTCDPLGGCTPLTCEPLGGEAM
jgi:hypothetical protein